ncbi:MAG TPA: hypothetical protein VI814_14635 [Candidatus Limnocylindria bacterium]
MKIVVRLVIAALVLIALAGGGIYIASQQKPSVARGLAPVPTSSMAAQSFDRKVQQLDDAAAQAKKTGTAQIIQVSFTEQELTTKAAEAAASQSGVQARIRRSISREIRSSPRRQSR